MTARTFDHVIIGAGILGLTTAFELISRDVPPGRIVVLDPAPVSGATRVAGGMLAPVAEVQYQQEPLYPLMVESARLFPELIERVRRHTDRDTGYRTAATFVVAADRADAVHLAELTAHQQRHGMAVARLPLRQARREEPGLHPQLAGVVEIPGDHQLNPRLFAETLLATLRELGVTILAERVETLEGAADDSGMIAHCDAVRTTDGHRLPVGSAAYLCNGLGAATTTGWYPAGGPTPLHLRPVRGDMLTFTVPTGRCPPVGRVIRAFVEDRPVYVIPRTDGTLAVGATTREDERRGPAVDGVHALLRDAIRVVPGLEDCEFSHATTGDRPGTPDDLPYLGLVGDNLIISTGYFRHGILLSALGAQVGVNLALTGATDTDLGACDPLRHRQTTS